MTKASALAVCSAFIFSCGGGNPENSITIAAVGPLTGAAASRGNDLKQAVLMAVDEPNSAGGIRGHQVRVHVYDDQDDPGRASELATRIATGTGALAVLGQVASSAGYAAGQVYKAQGTPAITGAALRCA